MHNTNCGIFIPATIQRGKKRLVCLNHSMKTKFQKKLQKRQNYSPVTIDVWFKGGEAGTWEPWLQGHVGAFCSTECPLTSHRAHSSHAQETLSCSIGVYESTLFKWVYFL